MEINPQDAEALNNMAWILATAPDASIRDGAKAVELAESAVAVSGNGQPRTLATLAAALAEKGRFADAVKTAERALQLAIDRADAGLANSIRTQLGFYQSNMPFRDDRSTSTHH